MNDNVIVTIRCLVYNHEPYIRQCLEGFVMQKTNFPFEAIIHDDASTDGSAAIIKEYAEIYPDIIKPIFETENQYSKHDGSIHKIMNEHTRGKYTAFCEGDDYWTDPFKLQKQVDFLEKHPEYLFCCTRYNIYVQNTKEYLKEYAYSYYTKEHNLEIDLNLFTKVWITQILTTMVRTKSLFYVYQSAINYKYFRDVHMYYLLLRNGKGVALNEFTGVYRWHSGGVASQIGLNQRTLNGYSVYRELYLLNKEDNFIKHRYKKALKDYIRFHNYKDSWKILKKEFTLFAGIEKVDLIFSYLCPKWAFENIFSVYKKCRLNKQKY